MILEMEAWFNFNISNGSYEHWQSLPAVKFPCFQFFQTADFFQPFP